MVWRVLTAVIVVAVVGCLFAACVIAFKPDTDGVEVLLALCAVGCLVATEIFESSPRLARRGAAGATSLLAVAALLICFALFVVETAKVRFDDAVLPFLAASLVAWGLACWRWGSPVFAALSAISLFLLLGRFAHGRALWILAGAALASLAARRLDAPSWAPSHRLAAAV